MQLVGEGKLSLNDKIGKYIRGVPNGDKITLRQVAGMTSGVASYTKNPGFVAALFARPERRWAPREVLRIGLEDSPDFPPGTQFEYSNTNFIMLGMVIQQVEHKGIGAVLRERIIDPLKLRGTSWPGGSRALPRPHAHGYTLQGQSSDTPADATSWSTSEEWTAGQLISTVHDLLVYGRATATGKGLLRQSSSGCGSSSRRSRRRLAGSCRTASGSCATRAGSATPDRSRASRPPSITTLASTRPSSSRPTATSRPAPAAVGDAGAGPDLEAVRKPG